MGTLGTWLIAGGAILRATVDGRFGGIHLPTLGVVPANIGAVVLLTEMARIRSRTGPFSVRCDGPERESRPPGSHRSHLYR